ncbi:MAG: TonB-dependent receptor [Proteobacteria bacterium]|nr:TonB-dependent receptor [Pseudomonadota bacterium]
MTIVPRLLTCLLILAAAPALAQRADENAVTAASDAFGTVVGSQTIGLYSPSNARGFNPTQAENIRIEGLYFDQQTQSANPSLFAGSDMRVGIAAQSYAFPSPSGIADYRLRTPGAAAGASVVLIRGPLRMFSAEVDAQAPLIEDVASVGVYVTDAHDFDYLYALTSFRRAVAVVGRIRPTEGTEIVPFFGYIRNTERSETPYVFADRVSVPANFQEQDLPTQPWTVWDWDQVTAGVVAKSALGGAWSLRAGLFHSLDATRTTYNDIFDGLQSNGTAAHYLDVPPGRRGSSYSGDARLLRTTGSGPHRRELTLAVRARRADREFGGDATAPFPTASIDDVTVFPKPALAYGPKSRDVVDQSGVGFNWREAWSGVGSVNVGVLRTQYRRTITLPATAPFNESTTEVLPTASFTVEAGPRATVYGSYTRGLEDSVPAPASAVNRGEPPPATPTWQADAGLRLTLTPTVHVLVGAFQIHKRFFGLDAASTYTSLGQISSRGIESSATVSGAGGLTVVAGAVWLRPTVTREVGELGGTLPAGPVPVGPVPRTINFNADYAPEGWKHWAASLQWTSLSSRVVTSSNDASLPPLRTLNLGVRYGFHVAHSSGTVRFDAGNVTNAVGLNVSPVYLLTPQLHRNYTLTATLDL